ncbi:MAG: hypothetical protein RID53_20130 [Coleofasciculus sp. B1-GNL1-01]
MRDGYRCDRTLCSQLCGQRDRTLPPSSHLTPQLKLNRDRW